MTPYITVPLASTDVDKYLEVLDKAGVVYDFQAHTPPFTSDQILKSLRTPVVTLRLWADHIFPGVDIVLMPDGTWNATARLRIEPAEEKGA